MLPPWQLWHLVASYQEVMIAIYDTLLLICVQVIWYPPFAASYWVVRSEEPDVLNTYFEGASLNAAVRPAVKSNLRLRWNLPLCDLKYPSCRQCDDLVSWSQSKAATLYFWYCFSSQFIVHKFDLYLVLTYKRLRLSYIACNFSKRFARWK